MTEFLDSGRAALVAVVVLGLALLAAAQRDGSRAETHEFSILACEHTGPSTFECEIR